MNTAKRRKTRRDFHWRFASFVRDRGRAIEAEYSLANPGKGLINHALLWETVGYAKRLERFLSEERLLRLRLQDLDLAVAQWRASGRPVREVA